ncbi:MAG: Asp-tRNA(Asn)/Glu-tRNA(Gln) amidotransferase subunit GatB [Candidatus Nanoarchaeia archaeon]
MKTIIGLEVHVELDTDTKLFCGCTNKGENPNDSVCEICLGMPGSKPVLNKKALNYALRICLALKCNIAKQVIFSRKTYFYPDMAKNYQITQYEMPVGNGGVINIGEKNINLTRIHLEEDPAALIHQGSSTLIDYNRSGHPLIEIVTEPEIESPEEAREFLKKLITTLNYLGIFDEKNGIIKADANISMQGSERVEIKNITGFKEIERALNYEVLRQQEMIKQGQKIKRETRGWDSDKGITSFQRSKEQEEDYGYILDSDLVPIDLTEDYLKEIKKDIPELAHEKIQKYIKIYNIKKEDAEVIASEYLLADLFEKVAKKINPELAAKWLKRELMRVVAYNKLDLHDLEIDETHLIELLELIEKKQITEQVGQRIIEQLIEKPFSPKEYVKKQGIKVVSSEKELEEICKKAISENKKAADDYKNGNEKSLQFIAGQVMRITKGQAEPHKVQEILKKLLK